MVLDANQSVELHVHPEWTDESNSVIFPHIKSKREHLKYFTTQEQTHLLSLGKDLLTDAGCNNITAFRAGSFGANNDTLSAVEASGLSINSSYNYCFTENCEINVFDDIQPPVEHNGIMEVPMTTFIDGSGKRRDSQLTACSYAELSSSMINAYEQKWQSHVLLSHSFELMKPDFSSYDKLAVKRFEKLCVFLANNTDKFQTSFFDNVVIPKDKTKQHLKTGLTPLLKRYYEQSLRKII